MLGENLQSKVWAYLAGIVKNVRGKPIQIGGTADHAHLLIALPSDLPVAKMVNVLKSNSSKWLNENGSKFSWQEGYGAFSVSASNVAAVARYIREQKKHHKRRDSKRSSGRCCGDTESNSMRNFCLIDCVAPSGLAHPLNFTQPLRAGLISTGPSGLRLKLGQEVEPRGRAAGEGHDVEPIATAIEAVSSKLFQAFLNGWSSSI